MAVNSAVPGNQRTREFEARFTVTLPDLPRFGKVTDFSISKRRSPPETSTCRKSLRINGKTRNAGRSSLSAIAVNSWGSGSSRRTSKLPERNPLRTSCARSLVGERASPVFYDLLRKQLCRNSPLRSSTPRDFPRTARAPERDPLRTSESRAPLSTGFFFPLERKRTGCFTDRASARLQQRTTFASVQHHDCCPSLLWRKGAACVLSPNTAAGLSVRRRPYWLAI
jgi:hypothetical protein